MPQHDESRSLIGHNSVASERLKAIVARIENLEGEKRAIADDIKDVYAEAKFEGFDTKVIRKIIAERKLDTEVRLEFETILDLYRHALGMAAASDDDSD